MKAPKHRTRNDRGRRAIKDFPKTEQAAEIKRRQKVEKDKAKILDFGFNNIENLLYRFLRKR
jgi:hypothetical protein